MDTRPIFVVITARNCSACDSFKGGKTPSRNSLWSQIQDKIKNKPDIRLIHIDVPQLNVPENTQGTKGERIPRSLSKIVQYFPFFLVITGSSWNDALRNPNATLKYKIYTPQRGDTADGILSWVDNTARSHEFINSTPSMSTTRSSNPLEPRTKSVKTNTYNTNTNTTNTNTNNTSQQYETVKPTSIYKKPSDILVTPKTSYMNSTSEKPILI